MVCGGLYRVGRMYTCSEECHEKMVDGLVEKFGEFKKIVDVETGVAYKVPTAEVLERGLWREDLKKHPKWRASDDCIEVPKLVHEEEEEEGD